MISARHLTKRFGRLRALDDFNVTMERGQSVLLIGPNGSGKTTFIKCVLGLVLPDKGELTLDGDSSSGKPVAAPRNRLHAADRPVSRPPARRSDHRNDARNPPWHPHAHRRGPASTRSKSTRSRTSPRGTLSGGTRQKVSACLAFLFDPDILILDEPTAGLDPVAAEILKDKVRAEMGRDKLILLTTHILSDFDEITTHVLHLIDGRLRFLPLHRRTDGGTRRPQARPRGRQNHARNRNLLTRHVQGSSNTSSVTSSAAGSCWPMRLFLLAASFGLFNLGGDVSKGLIGLLSLILFVVPLVGLVFGTIHFYNSYEFIELLATQPLKRRTILLAEFIGVAVALCGALLSRRRPAGRALCRDGTGFTLLGVGLALTLIFIALAFLGAVATRDKARGIGVAILLWFYFALLHGGLMLLVMFPSRNIRWKSRPWR